MADRLTRGRQKIELKKIQNEEDRLITFSKRRSGVYKKASEISTLCGVQVGILIFSPSGKPFTYGKPDIETIINRFFGRNYPPQNDMFVNIFHAYNEEKLQELNHTYDELSSSLDALKKKGSTLSKSRQPIKDQAWWEAPIEDLKPQEMDELIASMEKLNESASRRAQELATGNFWNN